MLVTAGGAVVHLSINAKLDDSDKLVAKAFVPNSVTSPVVNYDE